MTEEKKIDFKSVYFQPPGINPKYCEVGMVMESDPDYIWYMNEPCKILKSDVKIIDRGNIIINAKDGTIEVKKTKKSIHEKRN